MVQGRPAGSPETSEGWPTLSMGVLEHTSPSSLGFCTTGAARGVSMYHGCAALDIQSVHSNRRLRFVVKTQNFLVQKIVEEDAEMQ